MEVTLPHLMFTAQKENELVEGHFKLSHEHHQQRSKTTHVMLVDNYYVQKYNQDRNLNCQARQTIKVNVFYSRFHITTLNSRPLRAV